MKSILITIILIAVQSYVTPAMAKNDNIISTDTAVVTTVDELAKIKQQKLAIDANLKKQEAVCYKKFAVSDCLKEAKIEAQTALNKVKRQEIEIKDLHRNGKIESDLNAKEKALNENAGSKKNLVGAAEAVEPKDKSKTAKVAKPARPIKTDAEILSEKNANDLSRADAAKKRLDESRQKLAASQKKAQMRANKNSQSSATAAAYTQKLTQAEAHKAALEKKNLESKKAKSAPLPMPLHLSD